LAPIQIPSWYNHPAGDALLFGVLAPIQIPSWYNAITDNGYYLKAEFGSVIVMAEEG